MNIMFAQVHYILMQSLHVIYSLIGLVGPDNEVGDVTGSELDHSDVADAMDEFCDDRRSLDSLSDTLQPINKQVYH